MAALVPPSVIPVAVTVLAVPLSASANVAEPPVKVTSAASAANTPVKVLVKIVAVLLPSYTLLPAVKLPVKANPVILAEAVPTLVRL
ncbi:hypothetical protein D3C87_898890 [compost metagenome]